MAIVKQRTSDWPDNDGERTSNSIFKLTFSERSLDLVRGFSMNLKRSDNFGFHGYSSHWKLDIVKQGMSDWPGNDRKMTSHNSFKLRFYERSLNIVRGFLFWFGLIWEVWLQWLLKIGRATTEKWRHKTTLN